MKDNELEPDVIRGLVPENPIRIETLITQRLNKILACKHVFDGRQGDIPKEWLLACRECRLNIRAEAISYADIQNGAFHCDS